ncbi:MAG: DNA repair exonuclease, partial [Burkholderiales bacterium]
MSTFRFIHAADLHLDSPLLGLAGKSSEFAARVQSASRDAFDSLIAMAIGEQCRFVLLAGDIFDGELRNFQAGLHFLDGMRRLGEAGIDVFMVLGNHDAANRFADKLALTNNVHLFPKAKAGSRTLDDVGVAIHGRSFPRWDMDEDMARDYPPAASGLFNIGLLHTACAGSEGPHARYAPCTLEQLANHGYDYWALGHVRAHAVLSESPFIVYPGNLQGRHPREAGPKGAVVVEVSDGAIVSVEHRPLDAIRWTTASADIAEAETRTDMLDLVRDQIHAACTEAGERPIALRLVITGISPLHASLRLDSMALREDVEALLVTVSSDIWLEKLVVETEAAPVAAALDPTIAGRIDTEVGLLAEDDLFAAALEARLAEIRTKLPAGAHAEAFIEQMRIK